MIRINDNGHRMESQKGLFFFPCRKATHCRTISIFVIRRHALFFFFLYFFSYFSITFLALTINDNGVQAIPRFQWTISVSDDVSVFSEHQRCNSMSMRIIYSKTEQSRFLWWYTNVYINIMYIYIYKSSDILSNGMMRWSETLDYWSLCVFSYVRNNTRKTRTLRLYIYIYKIRKIFPS